MFGFLVALVAGAVTSRIETPLARPAARRLGEYIDVRDSEVRVLSFMIAMIIAGIICAVFESGSALGLAVGGTLGYFAMRMVRRFRRMIDNKNA